MGSYLAQRERRKEITIRRRGMPQPNFFINLKYYPFAELVKAFALVAFFHFGLYFVSKNYGFPVYPSNPLEVLLVYTFTGFVLLGWLLGERKKFFLVVAYFVTFQILGLAIITEDPFAVSRILSPIFFTYLPLFLFKSPTEFHREVIERHQKTLLKELEHSRQKLEEYENLLKDLNEEYRRLLKEKEELESLLKETDLKELRKLVEEKENLLKDYKRKIQNLEEKLEKLRENNRQLWELLEETTYETYDQKSLRAKLTETRRELRHKKRELDNCLKDLQKSKEEIRLLEEELERAERNLNGCLEERETLKGKLETKTKEFEKLLSAYEKDLGTYLNFLFEKLSFSPKALVDLSELSDNVKQNLFKFLRRFDQNPDGVRMETLETSKEKIYRARFSGGRLYLTKKGNKWEIVGILEGEDEKSKDRFIRERFS